MYFKICIQSRKDVLMSGIIVTVHGASPMVISMKSTQLKTRCG